MSKQLWTKESRMRKLWQQKQNGAPDQSGNNLSTIHKALLRLVRHKREKYELLTQELGVVTAGWRVLRNQTQSGGRCLYGQPSPVQHFYQLRNEDPEGMFIKTLHRAERDHKRIIISEDKLYSWPKYLVRYLMWANEKSSTEFEKWTTQKQKGRGWDP